MENIGAVKRSSTSMKSISRKDSKGVSFREKLDGVTSRNPKENIEKLFNLRVEARAVGKDDKSVFSNVRAGLAPVVIAPNILKKMETDKDLEDTRIHIYEGTASMDEILEKMKSGGYLW